MKIGPEGATTRPALRGGHCDSSHHLRLEKGKALGPSLQQAGTLWRCLEASSGKPQPPHSSPHCPGRKGTACPQPLVSPPRTILALPAPCLPPFPLPTGTPPGNLIKIKTIAALLPPQPQPRHNHSLFYTCNLSWIIRAALSTTRANTAQS